MKEEKVIAHECRAAGLVFETMSDWINWLKGNKYDIKKPVAEHKGFKFNINDACINPHIIEYSVDGEDNWRWKAMTSKTQFGWIWGYDIIAGGNRIASPAAYPSRYDNSAIFYETENQAAHDALSFIIRQLEGLCKSRSWRKNKNKNILLWAAKKKRADIIHPQMELFEKEVEK